MALNLKPDIKTKRQSIDDKLYTTKFKVDEVSHLAIKDPARCAICLKFQCLTACPAHVYSRRADQSIEIAYSGCLECGTCQVLCDNIDWRYPTGGFGVSYRFG
jgi:ferredoxin like protein